MSLWGNFRNVVVNAMSKRPAQLIEVKIGMPNAKLTVLMVAKRDADKELDNLQIALAESDFGDSGILFAKFTGTWGEALNQMMSAVTSPLVLVLDVNMAISGASINELVRVHLETKSAATAPVVIKRLGTIVDAGCAISKNGQVFSPYVGFSVADIPVLTEAPVAVLGSPAFVFNRADFDLVSAGFASGPVGSLATAAFSMQLAQATGKPLTMAYMARATSTSGTFVIDGKLPTELQPKRKLLGKAPATIDASMLAARGGFVFNQDRNRIERPVGSPPRWAVKIAAPIGPLADAWGDTHFARDVMSALNAQGIETVLDYRDTEVRPESDHLDDVRLVLRGLRNVPINRTELSPNVVNILWLISHPELVTLDELKQYDLVFSASANWAKKMTAQLKAAGSKVEVLPLLQATSIDPLDFKPETGIDLSSPDLSSDVLFVGNTRHTFREVVREAIAAKANLTVYGKNWDEYIDDAYIRAENLPNHQLPQAYASARVVLNDHWADMRDDGFVSNRLFDAVSSGARVLSDHIDGLDELFEGAVQTYKTSEDFARLVADGSTGTDGDGGHWPSDDEMRQIAARVAANHSFDHRAAELIDAVNKFRAAR